MQHQASSRWLPTASARALAVVLLLVTALSGASRLVAAQEAADLGFSPATGHARVIAQGVVALPAGEAVWRTVRTRAPLPAEAAFVERPLGFVLARSGPLLLTDQDSGEQTQLGIDEAALTRAGERLQIASLATEPVGYLSIELVSPNAPPPPESATVLQPGQPFPAPSGLHDVDLVSDTLVGDETYTIPDSGAKNVVLITDGAAAVGRPGGEPVVLLAGEAASFSGELEVSVAPDGGGQGTTFVVAMIGPEIPPPEVATTEVTPEATQATATAQVAPSAGEGTITIQVFTCPAGMTAETLNAAACAPATVDFDVTLSGASLSAPLTIGDAAPTDDSFVWSGLPFGDYVIAEAVLPSGFTSYVLSARSTTGNPETGYRVTLGAAEPDLSVRIYNFASS